MRGVAGAGSAGDGLATPASTSVPDVFDIIGVKESRCSLVVELRKEGSSGEDWSDGRSSLYGSGMSREARKRPTL